VVQIVSECDVDADPPDRKNPSRTPTAFWAKTIRMLCSHLKSRRTTATHRDDQQQGRDYRDVLHPRHGAAVHDAAPGVG